MAPYYYDMKCPRCGADGRAWYAELRWMDCACGYHYFEDDPNAPPEDRKNTREQNAEFDRAWYEAIARQAGAGDEWAVELLTRNARAVGVPDDVIRAGNWAAVVDMICNPGRE
jgi:hypothetical protein